MKLILALTAALLPALAVAADNQDPLQLSFERDLVREPAVQAIRPALAEEDALADAIQAALYGTGSTDRLASLTPRPGAAAHVRRVD